MYKLICITGSLLIGSLTLAQIRVNPDHTCYHDYRLDSMLKCTCVTLFDSLKMRDHTSLHYRAGEIFRDTIYIQHNLVIQDQEMYSTRGKLIQAFRYIEDTAYVATNYWSSNLRYVKVQRDDIYSSSHWEVKKDYRKIVTDSIYYEYEVKKIHKQFYPNGRLMSEERKGPDGQWIIQEYRKNGKPRK